MDLEFWATTDVGRVRDHNEDNWLIDKRLHLFVVCDGMGGHAAGEVASAMSVKIVREVLSNHREVFERLEQDPESLPNRKSVLTLVEHSITEACARIFHAAAEDPAKKGMGTTCSLLLIAQGRGFIGHVGDSRIYLYRQEAIHQITEDHSLINEMIRLGKIKKGEEHNLPHKNAVTRAVGVNEFVEVDTFELDVFSGDCFLLCSDGLSGYFKDDSQIVKLVDQDDIKKIAQDCIDFANAGGGKDNITSILVRVGGDQKTESIQRRIEVMRATPYFRYLGYKELVQSMNFFETVEYDNGDVVFEADVDPAALFLIVEGTVSLRRGSSTVAKLGPGDTFGETSIIDETAQSIAVHATSECEVLTLSRDRFMELLRSDDNLAIKLLWNFLQEWTSRLRRVPYEKSLSRRAQGIDEPTPPSSKLAFEEDRRKDGHQPSTVSGEFVDADLKKTTEAPASRRASSKSDTVSSTEPGEESDPEPEPAAKPAPRSKRAPSEALTMPAKPSSGRRAQTATIDPDKTVPDNGLGGLAWDDIIPPDLLEDEESLRETVQMDRDGDTTGPMGAAEELRETTADLGKPISGESTTRSITPQAQVLKRTKLVVGEGSDFDGKEHTRDVKPLSAGRSTKSDSTLELEIDDDSVEEVN